MSRPLTAALITGGAGFVGTNLAARLAAGGRRVLVLDDLSRGGAERNVEWLRARYPGLVRLRVASVLDADAVADAVRQVSEVYHLAAQVAVTTSVSDPVRDFDVNARGTLHVLEAIRRSPDSPPLLFTSTNKVYGALDDIELVSEAQRYTPRDPALRASGIDERRSLDFHSPYGCSKGAADQYVLDYARTYGLRALVFRMSCIYGPHQHGTEDQGWVAHFVRRASEQGALTVYGDGRQVRDVLYVDDLVDAFQLAMRHIERIGGRAFNIGGGPAHTLSLLELLDDLQSRELAVRNTEFEPWRSGDQRYYVSDTSAFARATGWSAKVPMRTGLTRLCEWLRQPQLEPLARSAVVSGAR